MIDYYDQLQRQKKPDYGYYIKVIVIFGALFVLWGLYMNYYVLPEQREKLEEQQKAAQQEKDKQAAAGEQGDVAQTNGEAGGPRDERPTDAVQATPNGDESPAQNGDAEPDDTDPEADPQSDPEAEPAEPVAPVDDVARRKDIVFETGVHRFHFDNLGASLRRVRFLAPGEAVENAGYVYRQDNPDWDDHGLVAMDELVPDARSFFVGALTYKADGAWQEIGNPVLGPEEDLWIEDAQKTPEKTPNVFAPPGRPWELRSPEVGESRRAQLQFDSRGEAQVVFATQWQHPKHPEQRFELLKTYTLRRDKLDFDVRVEVRNLGETPVENLRLVLVGPNGLVPDEFQNLGGITGNYCYIYGRLAYKEPDADAVADAERVQPDFGYERSDLLLESTDSQMISWGALTNRYFALIARPSQPEAFERIQGVPVPTIMYEPQGYDEEPPTLTDNRAKRIKDQLNLGLVFTTKPVDLQPGTDGRSWDLSVYLGPQKEEILEAYGTRNGENLHYNYAIDYGFGPDALARFFQWVLTGLTYVTGVFPSWLEWGLAILLITLIVKGGMHPLTVKQMRSMHMMQKLAPKIKELQEKYKGQNTPEAKRKMQQEQMKLYQDAGVNPLGGCLPMLIQFPIFIGLYGMIRVTFELRQANFLWISDLSLPDQLFSLPFTIPLLGWSTFNLLPIAYAVLMFIQNRINRPTGEMSEQQQQMQSAMKLMPLFLLWIFYSMPAGLVLYFTANMTFSLFETWYTKKQLADQEETGELSVPVAVGPAGSVAAIGEPRPVNEPPPPPKKKPKKKKKRKK
jgi:YidC/Oxa1 family membrane protein insertase